MSAIQAQIPEEDLGAQGVVSGEATPSDRVSTMAKFTYADEDLRVAYEAHTSDFETHDHASLGGAPLGGVIPGGTARADSFQPDAFTTAKLNTGSVSGAAIATGAINATHIPDQSVTRTKIGAAVLLDGTILAGQTLSPAHGLGRRPIYHLSGRGGVQGWALEYIAVTGCTTTTISVTAPAAFPAGVAGVNFRLVCK